MKNYKKILFDIAKVLEDNKIPFFLFGGTLLGAVRDKAFIVGDGDIDIGTISEFYKDYNKLAKLTIDLDKKGYHLFNFFQRDMLAIKSKKSNRHLDIVLIRPKGKDYIFEDNNGIYTIKAKHIDKLDAIDFYGKSFNIFSDAEEFFESYYGKDWKTPKTGKPVYKRNKVKKRIYIRHVITERE